MTKNQKIAAGCGGLGCLGLIVAGIAVGVGYYFYSRNTPGRSYNYNYNSNSNSNGGSNRNTNQDVSESTNSSSSNSSSGTNASYTDDEKHRLFQAASTTGDAELVQKVVIKLGLFTAAGYPKEDYQEFIKDHITWGANNADFIMSISTPEKARVYVDAHL